MTETRPPTTTPPPSVRERLFEISLREFRKHGFEQVPVSRITSETGVAKGTFFNHFATKDHVLAEWLDRTVQDAMEEVGGTRVAGADAILAFFVSLARRLESDRSLANTVVLRLPLLPPPADGIPRGEARIRGWMQDRLGEALPVRVPLREPEPPVLSALLTWSLRGALEDWGRTGAGRGRALRVLLREGGSFLLESAGLPVSPDAIPPR